MGGEVVRADKGRSDEAKGFMGAADPSALSPRGHGRQEGAWPAVRVGPRAGRDGAWMGVEH